MLVIQSLVGFFKKTIDGEYILTYTDFVLFKPQTMDTKKNKDQAIELAIAQIEKNFGKGSIMKMGESKHTAIETIPTNIKNPIAPPTTTPPNIVVSIIFFAILFTINKFLQVSQLDNHLHHNHLQNI